MFLGYHLGCMDGKVAAKNITDCSVLIIASLILFCPRQALQPRFEPTTSWLCSMLSLSHRTRIVSKNDLLFTWKHISYTMSAQNDLKQS